MCSTQYSSNDLPLILNVIVFLNKLLCSKSFSYVLLGNFQIHRLEEEFGIYCQPAGRCYYVLAEQTINCIWSYERRMLYGSFGEEWPVILVEGFSWKCRFVDEEESLILYISGYDSFKEGLTLDKDWRYKFGVCAYCHDSNCCIHQLSYLNYSGFYYVIIKMTRKNVSIISLLVSKTLPKLSIGVRVI